MAHESICMSDEPAPPDLVFVASCPCCDGPVVYDGGTWSCDDCNLQWFVDGTGGGRG